MHAPHKGVSQLCLASPNTDRDIQARLKALLPQLSQLSCRRKSKIQLGGGKCHFIQLSQAVLGCCKRLLQGCHFFACPPPLLEFNFLLDFSRLQ